MGERKVKKEMIRAVGGDDESDDSGSGSDDDSKKSKKKKGSKLKKGMKVEARFGGRSRWFKGKITKENSDGTFDILYNDGDRERKVKKDLIRSLEKNDSDSGSGSGSDSGSGNGSDSDTAELDVGSKVE